MSFAGEDALEAKALIPRFAPRLAFPLLPIQPEDSPSRIAPMPTETKVNPFKPPQPQIPGVPGEEAAKKDSAAGPPNVAPVAPPVQPGSRQIPPLWVGLATGFVVVVIAAAWWTHKSSGKRTDAPAPVPETATVTTELTKPRETLPMGPGPIATAGELAKPWSSKRFNFRNPGGLEQMPALAVRLPGGAFWGISLREPFGTCQLEYVTDLDTLRSQYNLRTEHPMVVNACSRTVYDLARYAGGPNGLVRGEIVRGRGARPPIAIEIEARGNQIVAVRLE
jgi:hypothetical protein